MKNQRETLWPGRYEIRVSQLGQQCPQVFPDQGNWNDAVVEVDPPIDNDRDRIIDFSKMHQAFGVNALRENDGSENKNIGDNGSGTATYSEISADWIAEELSGILSFN